jgi:hypothetical protein
MEREKTAILVIRLITIFSLIFMILPIGALIAHNSGSEAIFNRYSISYFLFILAYLSLIILLIVAALLPSRLWMRLQSWAQSLHILGTFNKFWWAFSLISLIFLVFVLRIVQRWAPGQDVGLQFALATFMFWVNTVVFLIAGSKSGLRALEFTFIAGMSFALALLMIEAIFRFLPGLIPSPVRLALPGGGRYLYEVNYQLDNPIRIGYRYTPFQDSWITFDPYDPGLGGIDTDIGPYGSPTQPLKLRFITDENGFMNKPPVNDSTFEIVALGDSFLGATAQEQWLDILGKSTGLNTLNLSMPGWGTQSEVQAFEMYGLDQNPNWVILAFFEGNDLLDVGRYEVKRASGYDWFEYDTKAAGFWNRLVFTHLFNYGITRLKNKFNPPEYPYPIDVQVGSNTLRLALASRYLGVISACGDIIEESRNFAMAKDAILHAQQLSESIGARLLLLYIPSEEHIYFPHIQSPEQLDAIMRNVPVVGLDSQGYLEVKAGDLNVGQISRCRDEQARLMKDFADHNGITFLDLTSSFEEEAAKGIELYNYSDTHWNLDGHRLAAKIIADFINGSN